MEENSIVTLRDRFIGFALRHPRFFEPLAPYGISYYLKGKLKQYKKQGMLSTYRTHIQRLGKWHYKIEIEADVTTTQLATLLSDLHERLNL